MRDKNLQHQVHKNSAHHEAVCGLGGILTSEKSSSPTAFIVNASIKVYDDVVRNVAHLEE